MGLSKLIDRIRSSGTSDSRTELPDPHKDMIPPSKRADVLQFIVLGRRIETSWDNLETYIQRDFGCTHYKNDAGQQAFEAELRLKRPDFVAWCEGAEELSRQQAGAEFTKRLLAANVHAKLLPKTAKIKN